MNIDEYRAMKAAEAQSASTTPETTPPATQTQPESTPATPPETKPDSTTTPTETTPAKLVVDGEEITPDQIAEWKKGYLRQSDYTRKTQEVARQRREVEQAIQVYQQIAQNPELAQQLAPTIPALDPQQARIQELETRYYDAMVEQEVATLSQKYQDFDAREAMQYAVEHKLNSLEDAYFLIKARGDSTTTQQTSTPPSPQTFNPDDLVKQITESVMAQLKPAPDTSSLITPQGGNAPTQQGPQLTPEQAKTAAMFSMSPEEYLKWANKR